MYTRVTHTDVHTHTRLSVRIHTAVNSVCVPTCGATQSSSSSSSSGSQMLIVYACITRVCTQTRADDIPVIRVANYICRCAAREERGVRLARTHVCVCARACARACARVCASTHADFRANKTHTCITGTYVVHTRWYISRHTDEKPRHILRACVRACVRAYVCVYASA